MYELSWFSSHVGTQEKAVELINRFFWNVTWREKENIWIVKSGEKTILRTDSEETLNVFIYGMALAYSIFSPAEIDRFRNEHDYLQ